MTAKSPGPVLVSCERVLAEPDVALWLDEELLFAWAFWLPDALLDDELSGDFGAVDGAGAA
jgi:hypothetical protein